MKRYTLVFDRVNQDVMMRSNRFLEEASLIEGVEIDKDTFSVIFEDGKEDSILALAHKLHIVDLVNPQH